MRRESSENRRWAPVERDEIVYVVASIATVVAVVGWLRGFDGSADTVWWMSISALWFGSVPIFRRFADAYGPWTLLLHPEQRTAARLPRDL